MPGPSTVPEARTRHRRAEVDDPKPVLSLSQIPGSLLDVTSSQPGLQSKCQGARRISGGVPPSNRASATHVWAPSAAGLQVTPATSPGGVSGDVGGMGDVVPLHPGCGVHVHVARGRGEEAGRVMRAEQEDDAARLSRRYLASLREGTSLTHGSRQRFRRHHTPDAATGAGCDRGRLRPRSGGGRLSCVSMPCQAGQRCGASAGAPERTPG